MRGDASPRGGRGSRGKHDEIDVEGGTGFREGA